MFLLKLCVVWEDSFYSALHNYAELPPTVRFGVNQAWPDILNPHKKSFPFLYSSSECEMTGGDIGIE